MVGRTPEYLGKKVEAREMKLAMLALLIHPIMILVPTGLFAAMRLGHEGDQQSRRARLLGDPLRVQLGLGQQRLRLRGPGRHLGLQRPDGQPIAAGPVQPVLGHRHRPGHAAQPLHPDHRPAGAGRRAWPRRSRRRSPPARCAPTRSRSASCCWARSCWSARCCSCRRRCWARWPNTWGRSRSADEHRRARDSQASTSSEAASRRIASSNGSCRHER